MRAAALAVVLAAAAVAAAARDDGGWVDAGPNDARADSVARFAVDSLNRAADGAGAAEFRGVVGFRRYVRSAAPGGEGGGQVFLAVVDARRDGRDEVMSFVVRLERGGRMLLLGRAMGARSEMPVPPGPAEREAAGPEAELRTGKVSGGGFRTEDAGSPRVRRAATFGVTAMNARSASIDPYRLVRVERARLQVVAGINYELVLLVTHRGEELHLRAQVWDQFGVFALSSLARCGDGSACRSYAPFRS